MGLLRSRLKAEWEELGDRQKEWEEKAKKMKSTEVFTLPLVFRPESGWSPGIPPD
jgi:hypothetical protein